jgi:hypothetical protein
MTIEIIQSSARQEKEQAKPIVIDFGKQSRKSIKKVRKGKAGKLLEKIHEAVSSLREDGTVEASAQTIIVVLRERRGGRGLLPRMLR